MINSIGNIKKTKSKATKKSDFGGAVNSKKESKIFINKKINKSFDKSPKSECAKKKSKIELQAISTGDSLQQLYDTNAGLKNVTANQEINSLGENSCETKYVLWAAKCPVSQIKLSTLLPVVNLNETTNLLTDDIEFINELVSSMDNLGDFMPSVVCADLNELNGAINDSQIRDTENDSEPTMLDSYDNNAKHNDVMCESMNEKVIAKELEELHKSSKYDNNDSSLDTFDTMEVL